MSGQLLGLPLEDALRRLADDGIAPEIVATRAPRRPEGVGALRVVRVQDAGRRLTVSAFVDGQRERADG